MLKRMAAVVAALALSFAIADSAADSVDQRLEAQGIEALLSYTKRHEIFGEQSATASIDNCQLTVVYIYALNCNIPGKVMRETLNVDLSSVGKVESRQVHGDHLIELAPLSLFGLILPGASVRSEYEYEHCGGQITRSSGTRHVRLLLPKDPGANLTTRLSGYISGYCRGK